MEVTNTQSYSLFKKLPCVPQSTHMILGYFKRGKLCCLHNTLNSGGSTAGSFSVVLGNDKQTDLANSQAAQSPRSALLFTKSTSICLLTRSQFSQATEH